MKKFVLLALLFVIITSCAAQNQFLEGKVKGKHDTFKVNHSTFTFNNQKYIHVFSEKNKYPNGIPRGENEMEIWEKDIHVDQIQIKDIVNGVLQAKLQSLHKRHETISGILTFDLSGNITDISFSIHENSIITLPELEDIDNKLRTGLKASFTGKAYLTHVAIGGSIKPIIF